MAEITRFAPSPTGHLHLGHAYAALFAAQAAGQGTFWLRLEDIDGTRVRPEYEAALLEDLRWLGLCWAEPVWRQSARFSHYEAALKQLADLELLYPCFCTRREIQEEISRAGQAPHGPDGALYPGTCRAMSAAERRQRLAAGAAYALRLDVAQACAQLTQPLHWLDLTHGLHVATPEIFGDVVLARKDTPASYHLAVVVDDAAQGITLVTRGEDLLPATHLHRLLIHLLQLPVPRWQHHRLILDAEGRRLAKRDAARSLRTLREEGWTSEGIRHSLALSIS
jgi:glutamyl-Q tRNA(Asp) synthetase